MRRAGRFGIVARSRPSVLDGYRSLVTRFARECVTEVALRLGPSAFFPYASTRRVEFRLAPSWPPGSQWFFPRRGCLSARAVPWLGGRCAAADLSSTRFPGAIRIYKARFWYACSPASLEPGHGKLARLTGDGDSQAALSVGIQPMV